MKTAVEQLIEEMQSYSYKVSKEGNLDMVAAFDYAIGIAKKYKKKEKEQITNAYSDGAKGGANGTKGQHKFGYVSIQTKEKYYNETYNQKKS